MYSTAINRLRRRDVHTDDGDHRLPETRRLRRQNGPGADRASLSPGTDKDGLCGTRGPSKTHSIESQEVRYLWHPWYGRTVCIHEELEKNSEGIRRCRDEN